MTLQYRLFDEFPAPPVAPAPPAPAIAVPRYVGGAAAAPVQVCVLGSGSGGNSTVVRFGKQALLIDAGFGPMTTARRLQQTGLTVADIKAICLTHLDQDHFRPTWINTLIGFGIRVYVHRWHRRHLDRVAGSEALYDAGLVRFFESEPFEPWARGSDGDDAPTAADERVVISTVRLPHDDKGTVAFHLQAGDDSPVRIGLATDLGHAPDELIRVFAGVDVLLIESNYDPQMQITSSRPAFLKKRIMGGHGHLSNEQCLEVCRRIADASPSGNPQRIVLLHRSQQCNTPELVKEMFSREPGIAKRIVLTQQRRRTQWIAVKRLMAGVREQLALQQPHLHVGVTTLSSCPTTPS